MNRRIAFLVPAAAMALAFAVLAGRAAANSSAFSFTMHRRAVNGQKNGKLHRLDAGELTLGGSIWVVSKDGGARSTPHTVKIKVMETGVLGSEVCSVSATPNTIFNAKRAVDKSCGRVESGSFWLLVSRSDDDGWHLQGSGTLSTK